MWSYAARIPGLVMAQWRSGQWQQQPAAQQGVWQQGRYGRPTSVWGRESKECEVGRSQEQRRDGSSPGVCDQSKQASSSRYVSR